MVRFTLSACQCLSYRLVLVDSLSLLPLPFPQFSWCPSFHSRSRPILSYPIRTVDGWIFIPDRPWSASPPQPETHSTNRTIQSQYHDITLENSQNRMVAIRGIDDRIRVWAARGRMGLTQPLRPTPLRYGSRVIQRSYTANADYTRSLFDPLIPQAATLATCQSLWSKPFQSCQNSAGDIGNGQPRHTNKSDIDQLQSHSNTLVDHAHIRWSNLARRALEYQLGEYFPPHTAGASPTHDEIGLPQKRCQINPNNIQTIHPANQVETHSHAASSYEQFRDLYLQPRRIDIEWPLSDPSHSLTPSAEYVLAQSRARGSYDKLSRLSVKEWSKRWSEVYSSDLSSPPPDRDVQFGLAEVINRDLAILHTAHIITRRKAQNELYQAYHTQLRRDMREWHERQQIESMNLSLPSTLSPSLPSSSSSPSNRHSIDRIRGANAAFLSRLSQQFQSESAIRSPVDPNANLNLSPIATIEDDQLWNIPPHHLSRIQSSVVAHIVHQFDLPAFFVRSVIHSMDARLHDWYSQLVTTVDKANSQFDDQQPIDLYPQPIDPSHIPTPVIPPHIHAWMMRDTCFAVHGRLVHSLPPISAHQHKRDCEALAALSKSFNRSIESNQIGLDRLLNGRISCDPNLRQKPKPSPTLSVESRRRQHNFDKTQSITSCTHHPPIPFHTSPTLELHSSEFIPSCDESPPLPVGVCDHWISSVTLQQSLSRRPFSYSHSPSPSRTHSPFMSRRERGQVYHSDRFHRQVEFFLESIGCRFVSDDWMIKHSGTHWKPDIFLLDPLRIHIHRPDSSHVDVIEVHWLELKSMYGACLEYVHPIENRVWPSPVGRGWIRQAEVYSREWGTGAVLFKKGVCSSWYSNRRTSFAHSETEPDDGMNGNRLPPNIHFLHFNFAP